MERLRKTANTLDTIVCIFRVLVIIALVTVVVATALIGGAQLLDLDEDVMGEVNYTLELGSVKLDYMPDTRLPAYSLLSLFLVSALLFVVLCVFTLIVIKYIRRILHPMIEGEPFRDVVAVNLKKLAWLTVINGIVQFFLAGLESYLVRTFYSDTIHALIEGSKITGITYEAEADLTFLFIAGVLFLLSYVFRYAQELQKLSDETL